MGDLNKYLVVPAFQLDNEHTDPAQRRWSIVTFHNADPKSPVAQVRSPPGAAPHARDLQAKLVDITMRSAAAPVYFPTYQNYIDGAVFANDPSTLALSLAVS